MIPNPSFGLCGTVLCAVGNHLWQSTFFAVVVWLLTLVIRKNHAKTRYWLWLAASIKFLVPFLLMVVFGNHLTWLHHPFPQRVAGPSAASYLVMDEMSQPFTPKESQSSGADLAATSRKAPFLRMIPALPAILAIAWLIGFAAVLGKWTSHWLRIRVAIQKALPVSAGREVEALRRIEELAGLKRRTELRLLPASMEPGIFGLFRPVLLWPQGISSRLNDAHLEAILAHETAHVRRCDNLTALLHMLVEAVFWFHPLVWWMESQLIKERERACDEEVLLLCHQPQAYAESILMVCEFCIEPPLTCVSGITGADLKRRVVQIMEGSSAYNLNKARKVLLAAFAMAAMTVPVILGVMNAELRAQSHVATADATKVPQWEMAAGGKISFDVASIRPTKPDEFTPPSFGLSSQDKSGPVGGLFVADFPLIIYIDFAFKLRPSASEEKSMLAHLPKWVSNESYQIRARGPVNSTKDQMRLMMQSLLADRFQLKTHFESRQVPVLALTLTKPGKTGPRLRRHPEGLGCNVRDDPFPRVCYIDSLIAEPNHTYLTGSRNITMNSLAASLGAYHGLDRPVVDHTGLSGTYDYSMEWREESDTDPDPQGEAFLEAVKDQLGLKFERSTGQVDVLVIDKVERPSEN